MGKWDRKRIIFIYIRKYINCKITLIFIFTLDVHAIVYKKENPHTKHEQKKEPTRKVYAYFNKIGWENVSIILIEQKELQTKEQLLTLEDKYILENKDNPLFLNTLREPIENIEEHKKLLHNENKLYRSLRFSCPCGSYLPGKKFLTNIARVANL